MAREIWSHSQCTVTWQSRMKLAWQSSVTIVSAGRWWQDVNIEDATHVTFTTGASLSQLAPLTRVSLHCEQFIRYECFGARLLNYSSGWWVSRDSTKMTYWGGASPGSGKCACGMNNSCANPSDGCNCDEDRHVWREDSGLLTDKTKLPVKQLRFGDTGNSSERGYHTLGKFKCYGTA